MRPRRADLFAGFDQQLDVETEFPAGIEHAFQRTEIDGVLAFVVRRATSVNAFAFFLQFPRRQSCAPLRVEPANYVAVTVGHDRRQIIAFVAGGNQERAFADWTRINLAREAERIQRWRQFIGEIAVELGATFRVLAFGDNRHPSREISVKGLAIEVLFRLARWRWLAAWDSLSCRLARTLLIVRPTPCRITLLPR